MFLHQSTAVVYPATVTHDWTLLTWQFDSGASCIDLYVVLLPIFRIATYDKTLLTWQSNIGCIFHMVSSLHYFYFLENPSA